ncbi:MAG: hypothetical protein A2Y02_02970 [Omnitrophica bacterium GWA2_52_12]|nr:MAG: hypothetical protein A2Y02_02970 [Omnitrophica bacterium GWA2_52_12]
MQAAVETSPLPSASELEFIREYAGRRNAFFGFREEPFSNTPDPDFFFMSAGHREALYSLLFGIQERRGFLVIAGEIGAGKTTLSRLLLRHLPADVKTAFVLNPKMPAAAMLAGIVRDFGIQEKMRTKSACFSALQKFLMEGAERSKNAVLVIDEAQWLDPRVLEELRMLSNLETVKQKLLQIVLIGQPELKEKLSQPALLQMRQRIGLFLHLRAMSAAETREYIFHRLSCASGGQVKISLDDELLQNIHRMSRGIPRLINSLCDRVLMAAYFSGTAQLTAAIAAKALEEMSFVCSQFGEVNA